MNASLTVYLMFSVALRMSGRTSSNRCNPSADKISDKACADPRRPIPALSTLRSSMRLSMRSGKLSSPSFSTSRPSEAAAEARFSGMASLRMSRNGGRSSVR